MATTTEPRRCDPAAVAAILAKLPPVFAACLDKGDVNPRFDLTCPAVFGEYVYATDGRVAVRMPCDPELAKEIDAAREGTRCPRIPDVFSGEWSDEPLAMPTDFTAATCERCQGKGVSDTTTCKTCKGEGYYECFECGQDVRCDECRGKGEATYKGREFKCEYCDGTGQNGMTKISCGPVHIAYRFLSIVRDAGAVLYPAKEMPAKNAVLWRVPGTDIEGLVMPILSTKD